MIGDFYCVNPVSFSNEGNQIAPCAARNRMMHSTSVEDIPTTNCCLELHKAGEVSVWNTWQEVDFYDTTLSTHFCLNDTLVCSLMFF